ncbi:unnamed protein product [Candidula unifasciata]|uniref:t-SNARE coiled-coil homology domain-containing protein n=1 Tax=Candidula unifasciata TaxID=100452 RepID=A0A8S3ZWF6_9EUPU|nr:unnamed protein product [Candidula unifasciata]
MPMRDRLEEMQQQRKQLLQKGEQKPGRESSQKKMDGGKTMQNFLADASKIEEELTRMKADVAEIKKLQQDMLSTPFPDKKDVSKYESLGEKVRLDATKIGSSLVQIETKYEVKDLPDSSAFKRVRIQQLNTLAAELNIATNDYFKIQAGYMDKMKSRLRRQLSARGDSGVDDSKINAVLDHDFYSVFTDNYIADVHDVEQTLRDLDDRKKDILALEKSVTDVNLLFKEMNLLVSSQGEKLTTIESAVDNAATHVESGNKELIITKKYQARARRKKCCIIIIILVILVIIGIIITLSLTVG